LGLLNNFDKKTLTKNQEKVIEIEPDINAIELDSTESMDFIEETIEKATEVVSNIH